MANRIPKSLILFHRHGHRAPAKNIIANNSADAKYCVGEHALWQGHCDIAHIVTRLDDKHPVTVGSLNGLEAFTPHDLKTYPFGNLTSTGVSYLEQQARDLCSTFPVLTEYPLENTIIHSTNFKRTQISAQVVWNEILRNRGDWHPDSVGPVPINVRHPTQCSLSFFDRASDVAGAAIKEVQGLPRFQEVTQETTGTTAELVRHFPRLGEHRSGFDWMGALDYYSCRRGHGLLPAPAVAHLEPAVYRHLVQRFSLYLSHPKYLSNFMGPLVHDLCALIEGLEESKGFEFHVFSGHDINLLGLLFLLRAPAVAPDPTSISSYQDFSTMWPDFGTTMVMEVHSPEEINLYMNCQPLQVDIQGVISGGVGGTHSGDSDRKSATVTLQELKALYDALREHLVSMGTDNEPHSGMF